MWEPGSLVFSTYEVVKELGVGGMASTFLMRHIRDDSLFAAKVPHAHLLLTSFDRSLFAKEVHLWISLPSHPHIVQCFFIRETEDIPVVFCEYVPSGTLGGWQSRGRIQSIPHALDLGIQLAEAMYVAELLGIVHRDLKPSNCLMDNSGLLKIGDFGLSSVLEGKQNEAGTFRGTHSYCSPEQFDGRVVDTRSDIWSFGVTLLQILSERVPLVGPAAPQLLASYREKAEAEKIPYFVWDFLETVLQENPDRRPRSFLPIIQGLRYLYERYTGNTYPREFPSRPVISARKPSDVLKKRKVGQNCLAHALEVTGGDLKEAEKFDVPYLPAMPSQTAEIMTEISYLEESCRVCRASLEENESEQCTSLLSSMLFEVAKRKAALGNSVAALDASYEAVDHLHRALRHNTSQTLVLALLNAIHNHAVYLRQAWRLDEAISAYDRGLAIVESIPALSGLPIVKNVVAGLWNNRSMALLKAQRLDEALTNITKAIAIREMLIGSGDSRFALDLAGSYLNRGVCQRGLGKIQSAIGDYTNAIKVYESRGNVKQVAEQDDGVAQAYMNRGIAYGFLNAFERAKQDCEVALEIYHHLVVDCRREDLSAECARVYNNMATICQGLGDTKNMLQFINQCIEIREDLIKRRGMETLASDLAVSYINKSLFLMEVNETKKAFAAARDAARRLTFLVQNGRKDLKFRLAKAETIIGILYAKMGRQEESAWAIAKGLRVYTTLPSVRPLDIYEDLIEVLTLTIGVCGHGASDQEYQPLWKELFESVIQVYGDGSDCSPKIKTKVGVLIAKRKAVLGC